MEYGTRPHEGHSIREGLWHRVTKPKAQPQPDQRLKSAVVRAIYVLELMTMTATHRAVAAGGMVAAVGSATQKDTRAPLSVRGERAAGPADGSETRKLIQRHRSARGAKGADPVVGTVIPKVIRERRREPGKTDDVPVDGSATPKVIRERPRDAGKRAAAHARRDATTMTIVPHAAGAAAATAPEVMA